MTMTTSSDTSFNSKAFVNCVAAFDDVVMIFIREINDVLAHGHELLEYQDIIIQDPFKLCVRYGVTANIAAFHWI